MGALGSPRSRQDTDLALQRGIAPHQAGDAEVEGSLPLDLLQQGAEGVLGEAEPGRAASGQLQAGSEWQSLHGGHHASPGIVREELQGTEQGGMLVWLGGLHWAPCLPVHLVESLTRGLSALNDDRDAPGCSGTGKGCICYTFPTETLPHILIGKTHCWYFMHDSGPFDKPLINRTCL